MNNETVSKIKFMLWFCTAVTVFACSGNMGKETKNAEAMSTAYKQKITSEGKLLFIKHCFGCHSLPGKEEEPDLRTLLIHLPLDSLNSILDFVLDSRSSGRKGGNILESYRERNRNSKFHHKFKDTISKSDARTIVLYSWLSSQTQN